MRIEFTLPLEPFSINAVYYRDRRHKTQAYKDWELRIFQCMQNSEVQEKLNNLRKVFSAKEHVFRVEFTFHYPNLLNKQGTISSKCEDLSNIEKVLLDVLFLPKFHVQDFPFGCKNVNVDDKYVTELLSKKVVGTEQKIDIAIELLPAPTTAHQQPQEEAP